MQRLFSTSSNPPPLWGDLLLFLQVTLFQTLSTFHLIIYSFISCYYCRLHFSNFSKFYIWSFSAGPFSDEGFPNKSGGVAIQHQYDFYPITECEQCALGAYLGQGVARLLSRTGQTANSADIRCGIQFAKAMWQKNAVMKTMDFWNVPLIGNIGIQYVLPKYKRPKKMKLDWIGCFSRAVKVPAIKVKLNCFKVSPSLGCFKKCCFSAVLRLGWNQKRWIWELQLHKKNWELNLVLKYL